MDLNIPIANPNLVNIIKDIKQGKNIEVLFWKEIYKAKFLCPVNMDNLKVTNKENNEVRLDEEAELSFLSIKNQNNQRFLMAFTDWNELNKWSKNQKQQILVLSYEEYQKIFEKNDFVYQGIVINPYGENLVLDKQILKKTMNKEPVAKKGESVMIGIPKEYPTDMTNRLKDFFSKSQSIKNAYLLWMVRKEEESYLLVLDTDNSSQQLFSEIGKICQPFLQGKLLDMVLVESGLGKVAIEGQKPFFTM